MFIENVGFLADHEGQRLMGARPEFEEGSVKPVEGKQKWKGVGLQGSAWGSV